MATNGDDASTTPTDPATPLLTLAEAYNRASDGDTVSIATGTYTPADTLTVAKGVTFRSATGSPEDVKIDGADARRPIILNHALAQLRDLVVMRGKSDDASYTVGSTVRINANGGMVSNCVIRGGTYATYAVRASGGGAGISCASSAGLIVNCVITNNTVTGNTGTQQGGGLYMTAGTAVGCYIAKNFATLSSGGAVYGGGVHVQGTAKIVNCTIVGNKSPTGAGVDAYSDTAKVVNCLIWDNEGDGDADVYAGKADCFQNCIARYAINDTCLAPGTSATKAPFSTPTPAYAGLDNSVSVDGVTLPEFDVLGKPRVINGAADIGCVEYQADVPEVAFSVSKSSGFVPYSVTFAAVVSGVSGVTSYSWDFDGDGTVDETTTESKVTHEYKTAGFFTPSLSLACTGGPLTYAVPTGAVKVYPKTMYVNSQNASPKQPYGSKDDAAKSLADALAIAADGQTIILLKAGSPYNISKTIDVTKGVTVRGETDDPQDVIIKRNSGAIKLMRVSHEQALIHSLVLQGGAATDYGLGVKIDSAGGAVSNCIVRSCEAQGYWSSAAVHATGVKALVTHCVITNNSTGTNAGGTDKTAGLHLADGAVANNCLIADNHEKVTSGTCCTAGVYAPNGYLYNCTIADNSARRTGGIRIVAGGVYNCVFAGNKSTAQGAAYNTLDDKAMASLFHNCASDDAEAINATCQIDGAASFFSNYVQHDYSVGAGSKLIDNGTTEDVTAEATDLAGQDRIIGKTIDIGCYEFDTSAFTCGFSADRTEGLVPVDVVFTGSASGTNGTDVMRFHWDFDGDGTYDVVSDGPTVTYRYEVGAQYTVSLKVENVTTGKFSGVATKPSALSLLAKTMYVNSRNDNPKSPYSSKGDAAKTLADALAIAVDGQEIVLLKEGSPYDITAQLEVTRGVTVRGETGNPEDVVIKRKSGAIKLMRVNHEQALVHSLVLQEGVAEGYGMGVMIDSAGGTVSNCIVRSCEIQGYWSSAAAYATGVKSLITHCVITNNSSSTGAGGTDKTLGLHLADGAVANNCLIAGNNCKITSGTCCTAGVYVPNGYLYNCTIADNSARRTGGIRIDAGGVYNCVLAGNVSTTQGATYNNIDSKAKAGLYFNCASDDAEKINATCLVDGAASFFKNYAMADYTVGAGSKLIDNGTTDGVKVEATDLAGLDRIIGKTIDIGCYEFDTSAFSGGFSVNRSEGIVPVDVVFTGSASGTNGTDVMRFHWDFDGDDTFDAVTDEPTVTHRYTAGARYTVKMKVENVTAGKYTDVVSKPSVLSLVAKTMYVVTTANPGATYPFDTWEKAASTVNAAVDEAQDGVEIVLTNGTHKLPSQLNVAKNVDLHGLTGRPEDVVAQYNGVGDVLPAFKVSATSPRIRDITWESASNVNRPGWHLEGGGTLTNCVLRNFKNWTYWASSGAVFAQAKNSLVTHCVITNITQVYGGDGAKAIVRTWGGRIENCFIGLNSDTAGLPLVVAAGPFVNNTVVMNTLGSGSVVMRDKYDVYAGGVTNCLFAANTVNGVSGNVFSLQTSNICRNLSDSEVVWPAGTTNFIRPAEDIFDAEAKTPWTISIGAISAGCRGDDKVRAPSVDLAGNPRKVGGRLDIGCYQCQKTLGFVLIVR